MKGFVVYLLIKLTKIFAMYFSMKVKRYFFKRVGAKFISTIIRNSFVFLKMHRIKCLCKVKKINSLNKQKLHCLIKLFWHLIAMLRDREKNS